MFIKFFIFKFVAMITYATKPDEVSQALSSFFLAYDMTSFTKHEDYLVYTVPVAHRERAMTEAERIIKAKGLNLIVKPTLLNQFTVQWNTQNT